MKRWFDGWCDGRFDGLIARGWMVKARPHLHLNSPLPRSKLECEKVEFESRSYEGMDMRKASLVRLEND